MLKELKAGLLTPVNVGLALKSLLNEGLSRDYISKMYRVPIQLFDHYLELPMSQIAEDIKAERKYQDSRWGGKEHDKLHEDADWVFFIEGFITKERRPLISLRLRLVKIAALALAALEVRSNKSQDELLSEAMSMTCSCQRNEAAMLVKLRNLAKSELWTFDLCMQRVLANAMFMIHCLDVENVK